MDPCFDPRLHRRIFAQSGDSWLLLPSVVIEIGRQMLIGTILRQARPRRGSTVSSKR